MAEVVLPPNPCLVSIILIIKTRAGVKHVFHYPADPSKERPHAKLDYENESEEESSSSSSDDSYSSVEDVGSEEEGGGRRNGHSDESTSPEKNSDRPWRPKISNKNNFLGLPTGFEHFLSPPSSYHKKRFEMSIGQLVYLGWPVFSNENGEWKRKKKHRNSKDASKRMSTISEQGVDGMGRRSSVQINEELDKTTGNESVGEEQESTAEDATVQSFENLTILAEEEDVEDEEDTPSKPTRRGLNMFHVVFVMNPPTTEYQRRVDEMYKHVVKKFSRALKWEQVRSNYVQKECEKMKAMKAKHDPASQQTLRSSTLAKAIATLYTSISTSRIAHIELTTHLSFSLQIPIPTSISQLPDPTAPQLPGLWLTTATSIPSNDDLHTAPSKLASHFALLLLTDLPSILTDIATTSSSPLTGPLTHYLRHTTPTKSFLQISQSSGIPLNDIHFLASHLIYWRRARAVPPLHQRDIYIVSPNADMRKLRSASTQYAKLFPALPTLPKMLSMLSGSPKPYGTLIPSKDHKAAYIEILAWLMRGGWVTQLRTFAWVRVPGRIQAGIARELENEKGHDGNNDSRPESSNGGSERGRADTDAGPPDRSTSRRSSASSARTAIPLILHPPQQPRHTHNISNTSSNISQISSLSTYPPKLILHPNKASALESRWLDFLSKEIEEKEGKEIKELWISCLKYFNGEHALEKIAIREGWKRKRVEALRATWGKMGILVEVRHW